MATTTPPRCTLIVGCGYLGRRLAALEIEAGRHVVGLVRSPAGATQLREAEVEPLVADLDGELPSLPAAGRVYHLAPPPGQGTRDPRLARLLAGLGQGTRLVLVSTTGVYGDRQGAWVDEETRPAPGNDRGRRRLAAEESAGAWARQGRRELVVLRVAAIYGPGRLPLERLRRGEPVIRRAESPWSNRIHVDDLARSCRAAAERSAPGELYNVADGSPLRTTDYFRLVAGLAGLPAPPEISMEEARRVLSPGMLSFLEESKRVDAAKLLRELGLELRYPTAEEGVRASLSPPTPPDPAPGPPS